MPASEGNRPVQAPGVGPNAKRHDLERRAVPNLHGSDLQQGDVQAMEQGLRIAPVQEQAPAIPPPPPSGRDDNRIQEIPGQELDINEVIQARLAGTLEPDRPGVAVNETAQRRAATWLDIIRDLANQPGASTLLRTRAQTVMREAATRPSRKIVNAQVFMREIDSRLEGL